MRKILKSIVNYLKEVKSEVKKVTWPNKQTVKDNTQVVIVFSAIFGVIIFGMDFGISELIKFLVK